MAWPTQRGVGMGSSGSLGVLGRALNRATVPSGRSIMPASANLGAGISSRMAALGAGAPGGGGAVPSDAGYLFRQLLVRALQRSQANQMQRFSPTMGGYGTPF